MRNAISTRLKHELVRRGWRPPEGINPHWLGAHSFGFDDEPLIRPAVEQVFDNTLTVFERLATLWQQVRYVDRYRIPGSFVECGVWKGGSVGMMALAHRASFPQPHRHLHLFDSFEGMPQPKLPDDGMDAISYDKHNPNSLVGTVGENRALLETKLGYPSKLVHYHQGWFQDSLPRDAGDIGEIAILRLDGDWYESTKVCLDTLYSKVSRGGVVIIDDYGQWQGCRKAVDEFLAALDEPVMLTHIDFSARAWVRLAK